LAEQQRGTGGELAVAELDRGVVDALRGLLGARDVAGIACAIRTGELLLRREERVAIGLRDRQRRAARQPLGIAARGDVGQILEGSRDVRARADAVEYEERASARLLDARGALVAERGRLRAGGGRTARLAKRVAQVAGELIDGAGRERE